MELAAETIALLCLVALVAGFIDAIAGGGGLVVLPALLAAGLDPVSALATNKLQSSTGTASACWSFARAGHIDLGFIWPAVVVTFVGAGLGVLTLKSVEPSFLATLMPILLIAAAAYFLLSPRMTDADAHRRLSVPAYALVAGCIGFYDGFFGPGAGSFYAASLVALMGLGLTRATAHTKLLNLTSNLVSVMIFAASGDVVWRVGLAMAVGQIIGGRLGSLAAMRWGAGLIRPLLVAISLAMTAKLLADESSALRAAASYGIDAIRSYEDRGR